MSERKFTRSLGKPGTAAQLRETVSQVVKESTVQNKPKLVEPIDFEDFILKNKTLLQNDSQRELLLYPADDISQVVLPRRCRTVNQTVPSRSEIEQCNLFTRQCVASYSSNWNLIHYKYSAYSGTYADLPKFVCNEDLKDETFEIDIDSENAEDFGLQVDGITKEGYLMKGPEIGSDRMFVNIGSKSFKRRYCHLRQEVDGTYILELFKDERKGEAKHTIVMDFCTEVVKNSKRGRFCFELRMTAGHKSYVLGAENDTEFKDWLAKLSSVLQQNKIQEEKRAASLERDRSSPVPQTPAQSFGTLKGLEHSMNPQLIKYARETDISIAMSRRENRSKLFPLYPQLAVALNSTKSTVNGGGAGGTVAADQVEPYREMFGTRVLVRCESVTFKLQAPGENERGDAVGAAACQIEPYHTSLCLYDAKGGKRLTENFHFDVNDPTVHAMLSRNGSGACTNGAEDGYKFPANVSSEWLSRPKQALLSITNPHPDIFLVVRIEKVLQGGICQTSEPYIKVNKDPKAVFKVYKSVLASCQRLGHYKMPFAWTARPLFRLYSNELDTTSDFPGIYRQESNKLTDEELLKLLSEYRRPDKFSKFTVIPGSIKIKISALNELPENALTTALVPLKPFPVPPTNDVTIEVAEFGKSCDKDVHPYATFVNHLYVYPQALNFDTQKVFTRARNIACVVELRDSDDENAAGLQCIYGRPGQNVLVSQVSCAVLHHNTFPTWYEEIKIRLPIHLHQNHHLLFTFYHISCEIAKKRENGVENCVGYAWIPLLCKGKLNVDRQTVPVAAHLPPGYLSIHPFGLGKGNAGPEINWIDSQRSIFLVEFNLHSTVNTGDQHLFNLFSLSERLLMSPKSSTIPLESETCKILKALHAVQFPALITFLPTTLNQLFALLVATINEEIGLNIIRVLINLVHMVYERNRKDILQAYVKYVFVTPDCKKHCSVHEEMCKYLPTILNPNNTDFLVVDKFMHHSLFFFEIIVKSMAQFLLSTERIKMHRHERFSKEHLSRIEMMVQMSISYVFSKCQIMDTVTMELNRSIATFLKKCLSLMDRGFVFRMINSYMEKFEPGDPRVLQEYKFAFLEIICSHEHYIAFNLPIQHTRLSPKNRSPDFLQEFCLSEDFCRHHFIVALLLQEVKTSLSEIPHVRRIAVGTLRDLLAKHELDDRYQKNGQMNRIALIYVPWLGVVLENLARLDVPTSAEKQDDGCASSVVNRMSMCSGSRLHGASQRITICADSKESPVHLRHSTFFEAIAGQPITNGYSSMSIESDISTISCDNQSNASLETTIVRETRDESRNGGEVRSHRRAISVSQSAHLHRFDKLPGSEVRDVLIIFLFVVKYLGESQLISWWHKCADVDVVNFFSALQTCLHYFRYAGARNVVVAKGAPNERWETNKSRTAAKAHTLPARMNPSDITHDNTSTLIIHARENRDSLINSENELLKKQQAILEQHLTNEVGLIALDCMGLYCMHFRNNLLANEGDNATMRKIFDIYLTFIQIGQSESLFKHIFAGMRAFVNNYSIVLFKGSAVLCGRLCYELLKCCNSRLPSVRQESCAILYLLMRSNFEFTGRKSLIRVHLQIIISVSQILRNIGSLNNAKFQESLSLINSFATSDKAMKGTGFPIEVKDLTKRVRTVLMATAQMCEHHHDPEMLVDLQHSLANGYASTPELRHTWLETMTRHHVRDGNYSEAACCQLHMAALMAEYLKLKNVQDWGAEAFNKISSNISKDERGLKLDVGVQDIQYTEYMLLEQLENCVDYIVKSERYELLGELYRLIVPMYEKKRNYEYIKVCYQTLAQNYGKVIDVIKSGRRLLGRFYKVVFYGQVYFEEENGVEYVYKEPKVTSLSEIAERLEKQYGDKFGADAVKIIHDSSPMAQNELDQKFAHIQVTHVTPYFDKSELEERQTEFEENHDISCFMFETPFTKDAGKAQGNPDEQWKRRTIITSKIYRNT
ncbi:hypothetical protein Trydic_g13541 [Trypoxylus dichotomus]